MARDIVQETMDRLEDRKKFGFDESILEGLKESGSAVGNVMMEKFIKPFSEAVDIKNFDPNNPESLIAATLMAGSGGRGAGGTVGSGIAWKDFIKLPKEKQQLMQARGVAPQKPKAVKSAANDLVEAHNRLQARLAKKKAEPEIAKQKKAREDRAYAEHAKWKEEFDKTFKEMRNPNTSPQRLAELKPYMEYVSNGLKESLKGKIKADKGLMGAAIVPLSFKDTPQEAGVEQAVPSLEEARQMFDTPRGQLQNENAVATEPAETVPSFMGVDFMGDSAQAGREDRLDKANAGFEMKAKARDAYLEQYPDRASIVGEPKGFEEEWKKLVGDKYRVSGEYK